MGFNFNLNAKLLIMNIKVGDKIYIRTSMSISNGSSDVADRSYYDRPLEEAIIWSCCDQIAPPDPIEGMINLYNCSPESKTIYV